MLIRDYEAFVGQTNLSAGTPGDYDIALYGLAGEIGSLVAALKRKLLALGRHRWNVPNSEIAEELGDCLWYLFALGAASKIGIKFLSSDIELLMSELSGEGEQSKEIRDTLGERAHEFLLKSRNFLAIYDEGSATLDDYKGLAFLTSRTKEDQLVEVCVAVLQQLAAELFRTKLPDIEKRLNRRLEDRALIVILGEIAWHLAALASLYRLDLAIVSQRNIEKLKRRFGRGDPTPLHDQEERPTQQFPRHFSVAFVSVASGRSRMYMDGRRLGADLTDNAYAGDGYRFHDVMHLALVAKLGWSPVLRGLMNKKRRSKPEVDEVEDGARAAIVEEAVIKAIHSEGISRAEDGAGALFANGADISFAFLKRLDSFVSGLEVAGSKHWEWEDAIVEGFRIFEELRTHRRGTVSVDLTKRSISFSPEVYSDIRGSVAGFGSATANIGEIYHSKEAEQALVIQFGTAAVLCRRRAILRALGFEDEQTNDLKLVGWRNDVTDVDASGAVQDEIWRRAVVAFRVSTVSESRQLMATAIAISDP